MDFSGIYIERYMVLCSFIFRSVFFNPLIYFKLFQREPLHQEEQLPTFAGSGQPLQGSLVKLEAPWGLVHSRKCREIFVGSIIQPSSCLLSCPGPLVHSFQAAAVPWLGLSLLRTAYSLQSSTLHPGSLNMLQCICFVITHFSFRRHSSFGRSFLS